MPFEPRLRHPFPKRGRPAVGPKKLQENLHTATLAMIRTRERMRLAVENRTSRKIRRDDLNRLSNEYEDARLAYFDARRWVEGRLIKDAKFEIGTAEAFNEQLFPFLRSVIEARSGVFSYVTIDLNKFKLINDRYGHPVGDVVLGAISRRLSSFAQAEGGFAARFGGDEFRVFLPEPAAETRQKLLMLRADFMKSLSGRQSLKVEPLNGKWNGWRAPSFSAGIREMGFNELAGFGKLNLAVKRMALDSDKAVYKAKKSKRASNIVVFSREKSLLARIFGK